MQYTIRLAGDYDVGEVVSRVERRRPLYEGLAGLIHKSYLFNEEEGLYAPFYVWNGAKPARAFLTSELFAEIARTFGRPRVRSWHVLSFWDRPNYSNVATAIEEIDSIPAEDDLGTLAAKEAAATESATEEAGMATHLVGIDADRWEILRYSTYLENAPLAETTADMIERFKVLYICRPEPVS